MLEQRLELEHGEIEIALHRQRHGHLRPGARRDIRGVERIFVVDQAEQARTALRHRDLRPGLVHFHPADREAEMVRFEAREIDTRGQPGDLRRQVLRAEIGGEHDHPGPVRIDRDPRERVVEGARGSFRAGDGVRDEILEPLRQAGMGERARLGRRAGQQREGIRRGPAIGIGHAVLQRARAELHDEDVLVGGRRCARADIGGHRPARDPDGVAERGADGGVGEGLRVHPHQEQLVGLERVLHRPGRMQQREGQDGVAEDRRRRRRRIQRLRHRDFEIGARRRIALDDEALRGGPVGR